MNRLKNGGLWVAAVSLIAGVLIAPVSAHVNQNFGHLWGHIKPKVAYEMVHVEFTVQPNDSEFGTVICPEGKRPTGGGVSALQPNNAHNTMMRVIESYPTPEGDGWEALMRNDNTVPLTAHVYAICTTL